MNPDQLTGSVLLQEQKDEQPARLPYQMTAEEIMKQVASSANGLSSAEADKRLAQDGPNQLQEAKEKSGFIIFLEQFKDLLVIILIIAAIISLASGGFESTIVIFAVITLNAILGTVQTLNARKSLASLKAMSAPEAKVLRDGEIIKIPAADVVRGDILILEAGDAVCADGRIVENHSLKANESSLTGESLSSEKTCNTIEGGKVGLGDQNNMVFSSSLITYGRAHAVVTSTGMDTEIGKIAQLLNDTEERKTPLQKTLDSFSAKLALAITIICALVFVLSMFRNGMSLLDSLMFAVALAVAAIPEAMATIVTIALAIGTQKMAEQNAIMKELKAVETLGCVSIICSDKTGTLTQNKMTVERFYTSSGIVDRKNIDPQDPIIKRLICMGILASDAICAHGDEEAIGDPTEIALIDCADDLRIDSMGYRENNPRLQEIAFDSERKLMSTLHTLDGQATILTKGAVDVLLARSISILCTDGERPITEADIQAILQANEDFSKEGLRVLSFGYKRMSQGASYNEELSVEDECDYVFVGLVAMMDPPRAESMEAVADAKRGGIRTIMITGDHKTTASAIARRIGIMDDGDMALEGVELDSMSDEELDQVLDKVSVYARVSPEHKIRIVDAWQRKGCIASMTGDGVNDAPALKKADIGVAMGITGTDVSKDAASMILADDNFATIVKAVINGRAIYSNIRNTILYLLSGNTAGIIAVLYAAIAGLSAPFAAVHLLFINLITDSLPAIAIAMETARKDLLDEKPRDPNESLLNKRLFVRIGLQGIIISITTMTSFYVGMQSSIEVAMTMAFATLSLARLFHGFNCRGEHSIFRLGLLSNPYSIAAFIVGAGLLACVLFIPVLQPFFEVSALNGTQIAWIVAMAFVPTVVIQIFKSVFDKLGKSGIL